MPHQPVAPRDDVPEYAAARLMAPRGQHPPAKAPHVFRLRSRPPSCAAVHGTCWDHGVQPLVHVEPHFSNPEHVASRHVVMAGRSFTLNTASVRDLPAFPSGLGAAQKVADNQPNLEGYVEGDLG